MIRPICASFPRCTPRRGKPARIPHHRKHRRSPVECHILRRGWKRKGRGERAWTRTGGRREEQGKRNERAALKKEGRETTGRRRMRRRGTGGRDGEESTSTACHRGDEKKWKTDIGKRESFLLVSLASPPPPPPLAPLPPRVFFRCVPRTYRGYVYTTERGRISASEYDSNIDL